MEEFLLRVALINFNENILLVKTFQNNCESHYNFSTMRSFYLETAEELDSSKIDIRFSSLSKLLFSFIINKDFNFMLQDNLEENFNNKFLQIAVEVGIFNDLIKNLNYLMIKFTEFPKDLLSLRKLKLIFFMKINILLIFLILYFNRKKEEMKLFIKLQGDELEDTILRLFKLSPTHKYIPNRVLMCLHYTFIKILTSDEDETEYTCRKIEKREKHLNKGNVDKYLKPEGPKLFYDYEKSNQYIEKFYRRNMLKREKSDTERIVIVNILKVLLSTTDNNTNPNMGEYIKEYIPEIILLHFYVKKNEQFLNFNESESDPALALDLEINLKNYQELQSTFSSSEKEFYSIMELLNKVSLTALIICFYFHIIKCIQQYDLIQYTVFAYHLIDSNGLLVFLKILNQDYKSIEQQFVSIYDTDIINIQFGKLIDVILLYNLKLINKICYKNDEFIQKYLVECKVQIMLRKVLNNFPDNENIKKLCLKLFKCQLKFFDKKWREENVNIITSIYLNLKIKPENDAIDNYLKYERKERSFKDVIPEYFTFEELKKLHQDYHSYNYSRFMNNAEEFEKYQNSVSQSLYANIYMKMWNSVQIPEDFKQSYKINI